MSFNRIESPQIYRDVILRLGVNPKTKTERHKGKKNTVEISATFNTLNYAICNITLFVTCSFTQIYKNDSQYQLTKYRWEYTPNIHSTVLSILNLSITLSPVSPMMMYLNK